MFSKENDIGDTDRQNRILALQNVIIVWNLDSKNAAAGGLLNCGTSMAEIFRFMCDTFSDVQPVNNI